MRAREETERKMVTGGGRWEQGKRQRDQDVACGDNWEMGKETKKKGCSDSSWEQGKRQKKGCCGGRWEEGEEIEKGGCCVGYIYIDSP